MGSSDQDKQERITSFPNDFRDLPAPWDRVKDQLISRVLNENLDSFYGLSEDVPFYRIYHATVEPKLFGIAKEGLKAFFEKEENGPRIFVTPSPTLALWHAIENKPHDTLRKKGLLSESAAQGKPVLLQLQISKDWLKSHPDLQKPLDQVENVRLFAEEQRIGFRPSTDRLRTFIDILQLEVNDLKMGKEATNLGIPLPVDQIPAEFIFVDIFGTLLPVIGWRLRR